MLPNTANADLPDLESLRCFVAAAELLRFRAAARQVALSPAAFSERLRRLEDQLGERLFERTTRNVSLTPAGQRLLPHARSVLRAAMACAEHARGDGAPVPFSLTIGSRYELALSWLCPLLTPLSRALPERTVHLYLGDTQDLLARVRSGDIDAAVLSARLAEPGLSAQPLHEERYVFVAAPVHDADVLVDVSPDLPLFHYLLEALGPARQWAFGRHEYMGGIGAIRSRVLQGVGVAVLPEYFVQADLDQGRLQRLLPDQELRTDTFRLIWKSANPRKERLVELAAALRAHPLR